MLKQGLPVPFLSLTPSPHLTGSRSTGSRRRTTEKKMRGCWFWAKGVSETLKRVLIKKVETRSERLKRLSKNAFKRNERERKKRGGREKRERERERTRELKRKKKGGGNGSVSSPSPRATCVLGARRCCFHLTHAHDNRLSCLSD